MTFDKDYQNKAITHNVERSNLWFTQQRAELQQTRVAFTHGLTSGFYYGGILGTASAVHYRRMAKIPQYGLVAGVTYGICLASSAWFRFDL